MKNRTTKGNGNGRSSLRSLLAQVTTMKQLVKSARAHLDGAKTEHKQARKALKQAKKAMRKARKDWKAAKKKEKGSKENRIPRKAATRAARPARKTPPAAIPAAVAPLTDLTVAAKVA